MYHKLICKGASEPQALNLDSIGKQIILYGKADENINLEKYYFTNMQNITCEYISDGLNGEDDKEKIKKFVEAYYAIAKDTEDSIDHKVDMTAKDYIGYFGGFLMLDASDSEHHCKFIEVLNTRVSHSVPLFSSNFLTKLVQENSNYKDQLNINFLHHPMPLTSELQQSRDQASNSLVIFFVAIAFSLIPANFVTIIVKEKLNNSKHLMRVSGMNIAAY